MKLYILSIGILFSINTTANNGVTYNPNNRYGTNTQDQQVPQPQQQQGSLNASRNGNIVKDMKKTADKVDYLGEATKLLGDTAISVGSAGITSCVLTGGGSEAAGKAYYKAVAGGPGAGGAVKVEADAAATEQKKKSGGCYTTWGLVTAAGIGLKLNGMEAKDHATDIGNQACEISAEGCNFDDLPGGNPDFSHGSPQDKVTDIINNIPNNPGFGYNADTDSITMPDGSSVPVSAAKNGSALNTAMSMLSGTPEGEKVKKIKKKLDQINDSAKVISMGFSAPGGGGGSARGNRTSFEEDDSLDKLLAQMKMRNKKGRNPSAVAAGKVSTYNGGPIGHKMDNIFEMIHRAYDKYTELGYFYPPGTRLGPDGLPLRRGK